MAWRRWQPEDLLADFGSRTGHTFSEPEAVPENYQSDELLQAELSRIRQQNEQKGFAQGQARGLEEGKRQGYQDGLQLGKKEGIEQGLAQAKALQDETAAQIAHLFEAFKDALDNLDSVIPSRLVQLSLTAARSIVGKNIVYDNTILIEKLKQLLREDTLLAGDIQLRVSAEDMAVVAERLSPTLTSLGWELLVDVDILPGGCRITSSEGEIDATLSTRWEELCRLSREDFSS
ncbi:flagellar assembly protein FliH [Cedecea colo]|uniref:Flagellar assembly protein FliH n=2 Tax=Cedecea colo TaxID=2552946 RepID=A0ABX0VNN6_9ENTR|nr:flagellar assembly protein FliH [Cedecea colo]